MAETKYPFYKPVPKDKLGLRTEWKLHQGAQGCTTVLNCNLRFDKAPPALAGSPPPPKPPAAPKAAPKPPEKPNWAKLIDWATEEKTKEQKLKEIPPFDIRDIPKAMEEMGWYIAAKLARRWLDGELHRIPAGAKKYVYPDNMVDTDTVKLAMLLAYRGVQNEYDNLLSKLHKQNGVDVIRNKIMNNVLVPNRRFSGTLDTLQFCNGDKQKIHHAFQFQRQSVSTYAGLSIEAIERNGMTDVTASLGSFNLYAAVARANIQTDVYNRYNTPKGTLRCTISTVEITHIYVYAMDSYSFADSGKLSQYLGHWNKTGVVAVPAAFAVSGIMDAYNNAIDIGGNLKESEVFTPVRNRDYLRYQDTHQRGGDFLIFSDFKPLKLTQPIYINMGEICQ